MNGCVGSKGPMAEAREHAEITQRVPSSIIRSGRPWRIGCPTNHLRAFAGKTLQIICQRENDDRLSWRSSDDEILTVLHLNTSFYRRISSSHCIAMASFGSFSSTNQFQHHPAF